MRWFIIFLMILALLFLTACRKAQKSPVNTSSLVYYTCPMHTSVRSSKTGACPICNMALIRVESKKAGHEGHSSNSIQLDERQQGLAGILTDTVSYNNILPASTWLGTVAVDEEGITKISSRVEGRIEKLYVRSAGTYLQKGSPLYRIYSEGLLSEIREYIVLLDKSSNYTAPSSLLNEMVAAARNKLRLRGLSAKQIKDIELTKNIATPVTFYSDVSGYVSEVTISEGMYVNEGSELLKINFLDKVWVEAQVYSNESVRLTNSKTYQVYTDAVPEKIYTGQLVFNDPGLEEGRKIYLLRLRVANTGHLLIPGMMVYVSPQQYSNPVLSVPKSAVLAEQMKTVWVKTDPTTFEQRMVETGIENKHFVEILSGLRQGELVVASGAYLINSEFVLKSGAGQRHQH